MKSKESGTRYRLDQEYKLVHSLIDVAKPSVAELISSLLDDKTKENLSKIIKDLEEEQFSSKFRRTLCHGNLSVQNVMFKYEGGIPENCKLINFECTQYSPPICDVLQLIFFNTSENLRQHHYHSLLGHYYSCLEKELERYCLKIDNILPVEEWQTQAHRFLPLIKLNSVLTKEKSSEELKEDLNCPLLSRQDCYAIVNNKLQTTSYDFKSFKVSPLDTVSGFLGDYHKLQIKVCHQSNNKIINCFVKCVPKANASSKVLQDGNGFSKEAFVYETLVTKFQDIGIDIISDCLPTCYFQRAGHLMVFEDVAILDYLTPSPLNPFDFNTLCIIVKKLAKFHASTFIYEEKMSKKLGRPYRLNEDYQEYFKEALVVDDENHSGGKLMATGVRAVFDATNRFPELKTEENQKNLEKFWPELSNLFYSTFTASHPFRNVVSNGDLWSSNILVKTQDNKAIDCRFVDYQLFRYCPPGHDLLSILHSTSIREIRLKHEEEIKQIYYQEMDKLLKSFNYNIAKIFPYEDFINGLNYMRGQMVMQAAMYGMFHLCTPEQISSLLTNEETCNRIFFEDRTEFLTKMLEISPLYKERLRDRILDVYDYCNSLSKK